MDIEDIVVKTESEPSEDRSDRVEEPWTERHDSFLAELSEECSAASARHSARARRCRMVYRAMAVPSAVLPVLGGFVEEAGAPMPVARGVLMLASATSACMSVLNYGHKATLHEQFAGLYKDLRESIRYTLTRAKRSREACDVTMQKLISQHRLLGGSAPPL